MTVKRKPCNRHVKRASLMTVPYTGSTMTNLSVSVQAAGAGRAYALSERGDPLGPPAKLGAAEERRGDSYLRLLAQLNGWFSEAHDDTASITMGG
jgi:hypothetical protein